MSTRRPRHRQPAVAATYAGSRAPRPARAVGRPSRTAISTGSTRSTTTGRSSARPPAAPDAERGAAVHPDVVTRLVSRGIAIAPILLHTGVSSQEAGEAPQPDGSRSAIDRTARQCHEGRGRAHHRGRHDGHPRARVCGRGAPGQAKVEAAEGWTDRVVTRRRRRASSTDSSRAGATQRRRTCSWSRPSRVRADPAAYDAAVERAYDWHEFGDSALLLPARRRPSPPDCKELFAKKSLQS